MKTKEVLQRVTLSVAAAAGIAGGTLIARDVQPLEPVRTQPQSRALLPTGIELPQGVEVTPHKKKRDNRTHPSHQNRAHFPIHRNHA